MKRLTLVRHAKAESKDPHTTDFDRALTRRGQAEAQALARHLHDRQLIPGLLLASAAQRTRQTAEILAREFELPVNCVKHEERLYLAPPADILLVARSPGPKVHHLMIVGHNPGISELANLLAHRSKVGELGTAVACTMTFAVDTWLEISPGAAQEIRLEYQAPRLF